MAACILHNICLKRQDYFENVDEILLPDEVDDLGPLDATNESEAAGAAKRENLYKINYSELLEQIGIRAPRQGLRVSHCFHLLPAKTNVLLNFPDSMELRCVARRLTDGYVCRRDSGLSMIEYL
ncbi:hypothetical protein PV326_007465 [Microctonus aethiopoides]|nr:hypothetical protein PV326_007465 [Microctonus aethiopoides]